MKKNISIAILLISLNALTSCVNHRKNFFVEGIYAGVNSYNSSERCLLIVYKIDKDKYILCNGKNTVEDLVGNYYFLLSFYVYDESGSRKAIDFINLVDVHNGSTGAPITYVDKNFIYITPLSFDDKNVSDSAYYTIESIYKQKQQYFYFTLFTSDEDIIYN